MQLEVILASHALNLGRSWTTVALQMIALGNFYISTWEEYYTGQFCRSFSGSRTNFFDRPVIPRVDLCACGGNLDYYLRLYRDWILWCVEACSTRSVYVLFTLIMYRTYILGSED